MDVFMDALINIVSIIGIIVAGALILFFLADLLISVYDPSKEEKKEKKVMTTTLSYEEIELRERALKEERARFEEEKNQVKVTPYVEEKKEEVVNYWKAAEEEKQLAPEEDQEEEYRKQRLLAIEERRKALMKELEEDEEEEEETEEAVDLDDLDFGEEETEVVEKVVERIVVDDRAVAENEALKEEMERLRREIAAERARSERLAEEASRPERIVEVVKGPMLSREEYEKMLLTYNNRLELIKKQLKKVDKEYLPLARVWRTHERDESRLNRKEAQVAKQKVVLYGVNNYADIDEEKAKKLAEDLDLLDGLKLSVAHCREVMEKNKDKFPVLESTHNILKQTIDNIKNDITQVEVAIQRIEEDNE